MMAKIKTLPLTAIFLTIAAGSAFAQIQINHFGAGLSYWHRMYSGIDERGFLVNYQEAPGYSSAALMPTLSAEVNLIQGLALDGRIGLWSSTFIGEGISEDGANIQEELDQRIIPVAFGIVYTFRHIVPDIFNAYVGGGGNRYYIQNTMERTILNAAGSVPPQVFTGNNFGAYVKAGIEYMIAPNLGVALEGRYNTGSYNQVHIPEPEASPEPIRVSLQGVEAGLSLRYTFFRMFGN